MLTNNTNAVITTTATQTAVELLNVVGISADRTSCDSIAVRNVFVDVSYDGFSYDDGFLRAELATGNNVKRLSADADDEYDIEKFAHYVVGEVLESLLGEPAKFTPSSPEALVESLEGRTVADVTELEWALYMTDPDIPQSEAVVLRMDDGTRVIIQGEDPGCGCCGCWVDIPSSLEGATLDHLTVAETSDSSRHNVIANGSIVMALCCDDTNAFLVQVVPSQED